MVNPLWTFGVAVGMSLAVLIYQQYRRQQESMYNHEQPRNINFSDHDSWQSEEPSSSGGSDIRHRGEKKNGNKKNKTEEKSTVVVEEVESCGICEKSLERSFRKIDCGHIFHAACLINWRRESEVCPKCGKNFF